MLTPTARYGTQMSLDNGIQGWVSTNRPDNCCMVRAQDARDAASHLPDRSSRYCSDVSVIQVPACT